MSPTPPPDPAHDRTPAPPDADIVLSSTRRVPAEELSWRFSTSSGPGGQHVNTSQTRAEVRFDIQASTSLPPAMKERLVAKLGEVVAVAASDSRSQSRNRQLALQRLGDRLRAALVEERPRRRTRPTRASVQRRVTEKRRRGARKAERQYRPDGES